jgi:glutamine amidotransferase
MIIVIDSGFGNVGSVSNMLRKIGCSYVVSNKSDDLLNADKIIVPGVGSFDNGMRLLKQGSWINALENACLKRKTPILGICLGMQILFEKSEEGIYCGLGWIKGSVKRINSFDGIIKVPHMGWNSLDIKTHNSRLFNDLSYPRFYFSHSYCVDCFDLNNISASTFYGENIIASVEKDNIFGVQFHPEKSHNFGLKILKNFCEM